VEVSFKRWNLCYKTLGSGVVFTGPKWFNPNEVPFHLQLTHSTSWWVDKHLSVQKTSALWKEKCHTNIDCIFKWVQSVRKNIKLWDAFWSPLMTSFKLSNLLDGLHYRTPPLRLGDFFGIGTFVFSHGFSSKRETAHSLWKIKPIIRLNSFLW